MTLEKHIVEKTQLINFNIAEREAKKWKGIGAVVVVNTLNADGYFGSSVKLHPSRQRYSKKKKKKKEGEGPRVLKGRTTGLKTKPRIIHRRYTTNIRYEVMKAVVRMPAAGKSLLWNAKNADQPRKCEKQGTRDLSNFDEFHVDDTFFSLQRAARAALSLHTRIFVHLHLRYLRYPFFLRVTESNVAPLPTRSCLNCWKINWNVDGSSKWKVNIGETRFQRIF